MLILDNGRIRDSEDIDLADNIIKARKKGPWEVVDLLVKAWIRKSPEEVQAVKVDISDQREMLIDKKYGQTKGGKDMERRFTLIFPTSLQLLIRTQYKADELPFDRKFYNDFAKRYPGFRISERD